MARSDTAQTADSAPATNWRVDTIPAPVRFRPAGWTDDSTLWGLQRGRVTRLDVTTSQTEFYTQAAWSVHASRGVVGWRNENGTWLMHLGQEPRRIAGAVPDSATGFDGPPSILWSLDGQRALLGWHGEWDARYRVLEADGTLRDVETRIPGYFGNGAVLWLDDTRVLFHTVANAPVGKEPEYKESGWRGDLAVLDLAGATYRRVTDVADSIYLRVVGPYDGGVLAAERKGALLSGYWRYDTRTWARRMVTLPTGRAVASSADAVVMYGDAGADSSSAVLVSGARTIPLGTVARDAIPVFSPTGRRGAVATGAGLVEFNRIRSR